MANMSVEAARAAVRDGLGVNDKDFSMRAFAPENFLFTFHSQAARDHVLRAGRVPASSTFLVFRQWTRLARATSGTLFFKVILEIDEIPPHAWNIDSAFQLLGAEA